jgi:C4-dicarboxylate transporter DctM subunit
MSRVVPSSRTATRSACRRASGTPGRTPATLKNLWATLLLFVLRARWHLPGLFTVQEAAGIGATGTLLIGCCAASCAGPGSRALIDALRVSSAIMLIVVGAFLFGYFLTITQFTQKAVDCW